MTMGYIYALVDPRNPKLPEYYREVQQFLPSWMTPDLFEHEAYIGKTVRPLEKRLQRHCNVEKDDQSPRARWIRKLKREGVEPEIRSIFEVDLDQLPEDQQTPILNALEKHAIAIFRKAHRADKNILNGGDGFDSKTVKALMQQMGPEKLKARARKGVEGMTKEALMARGQKNREAKARWSPEKRAEIHAKLQTALTKEKRAAAVAKAWARLTPEERKTRVAKMAITPEKRQEMAAKRLQTMDHEAHCEAARKAWETLRNTPGALEERELKRLSRLTPEQRHEAAQKAIATRAFPPGLESR